MTTIFSKQSTLRTSKSYESHLQTLKYDMVYSLFMLSLIQWKPGIYCIVLFSWNGLNGSQLAKMKKSIPDMPLP